MGALSIAASGAEAMQRKIEVISHNLANADTDGFHTIDPIFSDIGYQTYQPPGAQTSTAGTVAPAGIQVGLGTYLGATTRNMAQGPIKNTGKPLDLMIQGDGFFQLERPDGTVGYTKSGAFEPDANGDIVSVIGGHKLLPSMTIPDNTESIIINSEGEVSVKVAGQVELQVLGTVELAQFSNPVGLQAIGDNLFVETPASGNPTTGTPGLEGLGTLLQGALQGSNVKSVNEITGLIEGQKTYEMCIKAMTTKNEMDRALEKIAR